MINIFINNQCGEGPLAYPKTVYKHHRHRTRIQHMHGMRKQAILSNSFTEYLNAHRVIASTGPPVLHRLCTCFAPVNLIVFAMLCHGNGEYSTLKNE